MFKKSQGGKIIVKNLLKEYMSNIGIQKIKVPSNTRVILNNGLIKLSSDLGNIDYEIHSNLQASLLDKTTLSITPKETKNNKKLKCLWGTEYRNLKNIIDGISRGFSETLILKGVGYRASIVKNKLIFKLGYSHEVIFNIPSTVIIQTPKPDKLFIFGINKRDVHTVISQIKCLKKRDVYKGKGILQENEKLILKEGKKK